MNERIIAEGISIGAQPSADDLKQAAKNGFRTIINLRTDDEAGVLTDEERLVEGEGMTYAPIPVAPDTLDDITVERFSQALASVDALPALVHCKGGGRAGVMTLLHLAIYHGWSLEQTLREGEERGNIAPAPDSPYRAFFESFIRRHSAGERQ